MGAARRCSVARHRSPLAYGALVACSLAIGTVLVACGGSGSSSSQRSGATSSSTPGCAVADRAPAGSADVPDAPAPLLVEQVTTSAEGPYVRRVSPDGSYWEYSSSITTFDGGEMRTTEAPAEWRRQPQQLTGEQVERLRTVVEAEFFDLAGEYQPPGQISDGFVVTWRACVEDRTHTVTLRAVDAGQIAGLKDVRDVFELVLGEAAAAEGDQPAG